MRFVNALKALWFGLTDPRRVEKVKPETAVAVFATAVLVLSLTMTAMTFIEATDPALTAESEMLSKGGMLQFAEEETVDLSSGQRQFTAIFGGALISSVVSLVTLAGMFWIFVRFLTDQPLTYSMAIGGVASTVGIDVARALVNLPMHLLTHTNRVGAHLGVLVDPASDPFWFAWLQRVDLFSIWQYLAVGVILTSWSGLHHRFGIVVGTVVFLVVLAVFAGFTLVAWIFAQGA